MRYTSQFVFAFFIFLSSFSFASEPTLTITTNGDKKTFTLSSLLKRADVEVITVKNDPAYPNKEMRYKAIAAHKLFEGLKVEDDAVIQFKALDGFAAPLSQHRLLNKSADKSIAYIALEPPNQMWPALKPNKPDTAGPFYLIWKNPELSFISQEEWPFMLAAFEVKGSLEALYPQIFPSASLAKTNAAVKGFGVFVKNCFACHTLNKQGASSIGPDLNSPMSPTEYFNEKALRTLIRNPQDLRAWPNSRMPAFNSEMLSNEDLNNLISYLKHMSGRKVKSVAE